MFAHRYFPLRYFPNRYFPQSQGLGPVIDDEGGIYGDEVMFVSVMQRGNVAFASIITASKLDAVAGAAATITVSKIANGRIILSRIYWSYSADPTGGKLTVTGGNSTFELDVTKGSPDAITMGPYVANENTDLVVTLAAPGGSIQGKLNIDYILEMYS